MLHSSAHIAKVCTTKLLRTYVLATLFTNLMEDCSIPTLGRAQGLHKGIAARSQAFAREEL